MQAANRLNELLSAGIVAIIRSPHADRLVDVAQALLAGGIRCVEITFTVPHADRVLERVADQLGDKILLGAGTVLDPETARTAILAGAQFIVAPGLCLGTVGLCRRYAVPVLPGALTPTEVLNAWQAGADVVKIFPADLGGPSYLKALKGPLPQIPMMPTGGVTVETIPAYLAAGACALGAGGSLVPADAIARADWRRIEGLARQFMDQWDRCRKSRADDAP